MSKKVWPILILTSLMALPVLKAQDHSPISLNPFHVHAYTCGRTSAQLPGEGTPRVVMLELFMNSFPYPDGSNRWMIITTYDARYVPSAGSGKRPAYLGTFEAIESSNDAKLTYAGGTITLKDVGEFELNRSVKAVLGKRDMHGEISEIHFTCSLQ